MFCVVPPLAVRPPSGYAGDVQCVSHSSGVSGTMSRGVRASIVQGLPGLKARVCGSNTSTRVRWSCHGERPAGRHPALELEGRGWRGALQLAPFLGEQPQWCAAAGRAASHRPAEANPSVAAWPACVLASWSCGLLGSRKLVASSIAAPARDASDPHAHARLDTHVGRLEQCRGNHRRVAACV